VESGHVELAVPIDGREVIGRVVDGHVGSAHVDLTVSRVKCEIWYELAYGEVGFIILTKPGSNPFNRLQGLSRECLGFGPFGHVERLSRGHLDFRPIKPGA
jgi:hypothetical protein